MSFHKLQIRYQSARSLPAPYAYFYTLTASPIGQSALQINLDITYPDRDDIDDDELIAEGYTRDDDFSWSGQLPKTWLEAVHNLVTKTKLRQVVEESLSEDDEFWAMTIETDTNGSQQGTPTNASDWQYLVQELMQGAYEAINRERPFELIYLDFSRQGDLELRLTASFAERMIRITNIQNNREQSRTLPWATLQQIMSQVYEHNFDPEDALLKRPKQDGRWLNLGTEEWYNVSSLPKLTKLLTRL